MLLVLLVKVNLPIDDGCDEAAPGLVKVTGVGKSQAFGNNGAGLLHGHVSFLTRAQHASVELEINALGDRLPGVG
jgi:hypothetical protein